VREISELLKLATAQANRDEYDAAIASLRMAYALMESETIAWPIETLFRLARYLHLSGRYAEAMDWLNHLHGTVDARFDARERLNKACGLMPWKLPKALRKIEKGIIKEEIAKLERRHLKRSAK
jgi:tetratricopeptide (TPR) repeat protein